MIASDRQSIFGDTYNGVPNPQIPFRHPYPTRYHGPIFTTPRFGLPFAANPYARLPYSGLGADADAPAGTSIVGNMVAGAVVGLVAGSVYGAFKKNASSEAVGRAAGMAAPLVGTIAGLVLFGAFASLAVSSGKDAPKSQPQDARPMNSPVGTPGNPLVGASPRSF